jgi:hypothetical protein
VELSTPDPNAKNETPNTQAGVWCFVFDAYAGLAHLAATARVSIRIALGIIGTTGPTRPGRRHSTACSALPF